MATNFESITQKIEELRLRVNELKPDIIFGTETWLKSDIDDCIVNIPGFNLYRRDTDEVRGGVILMVREHIDVELCSQINDLNVKDTLWLWVRNSTGCDDLIGVVYRKGAASMEYNDTVLKQFEIANRICKGKILINGDFNLPNIDWVNCLVKDSDVSFSHRFYEKLGDLFFKQHVVEPTRQRGSDTPSCLDLVISSNDLDVTDIEILSPLGKADHSILTWSFQTSFEPPQSQHMFKYNYNRADYDKLRSTLADKDWFTVMNSDDVNIAWDIFHEYLTEAVRDCVPLI